MHGNRVMRIVVSPKLSVSREWVRSATVFAAVAIVPCAACTRSRDVNDAALRSADADSANWITYGRTYSEQRYSPLRQINEETVGRLGLAWSVDLGTLRGLEATPLVKDGVMYVT